MEVRSQFKHVIGPKSTLESICLTCLLAVGVCSSEEELKTREWRHNCKSGAEELVSPGVQGSRTIVEELQTVRTST